MGWTIIAVGFIVWFVLVLLFTVCGIFRRRRRLSELQGHNSVGVLDSEGKALEDREHVLSVQAHLPELRCCFGGKREVDRLVRHREELVRLFHCSW